MTALAKLMALGALALGAARVLRRRPRRYLLDGKVALVSGGSRGLGLVVARELVRRGARVALLARDGGELERAQSDLVARGGRDVVIVPADVTDSRDVERAVDLVRRTCGRIDILASVAGDIEVGPFDAMRTEDFERAMETNFWGPLRLVRAVVPAMRARGGGRILNVSSIGGLVAVPHLMPYSASKFALTGLSLGLRAELAKDGIVVVTSCPGLMRTGSPANAFFKGNAGAEFSWFASVDSLPLLSTSAEHAARRMVRGLERGQAMVLVPAVARIAAIAQALAPGLVARAMEAASYLLPAGKDGGPPSMGRSVRPRRLPRWLTALSDRAAARNNENPPVGQEG